jgi:hypothetical protein
MAEQMQARMTHKNGPVVRQAKIDHSFRESLGSYELWDSRRYRKEIEERTKKEPKRIKPTQEQKNELTRLRMARKRAADKGKPTADIEAQIEAIQKAARQNKC